jgi:hypothetical protein
VFDYYKTDVEKGKENRLITPDFEKNRCLKIRVEVLISYILNDLFKGAYPSRGIGKHTIKQIS